MSTRFNQRFQSFLNSDFGFSPAEDARTEREEELFHLNEATRAQTKTAAMSAAPTALHLAACKAMALSKSHFCYSINDHNGLDVTYVPDVM